MAKILTRRARMFEYQGRTQWQNLIVAKPAVGFALPWAGAAAPAPAVRRRENLRNASFHDYAMEEPRGGVS
jgi:hypothetical protein